MKRIVLSSVLGLFMFGSALAADNVKFTFSGVAFPDGQLGTIQVATKTTKKTTITTCSYFSDPNNQYLGQFQTDEFASSDANAIEQFCLENYNNKKQ